MRIVAQAMLQLYVLNNPFVKG